MPNGEYVTPSTCQAKCEANEARLEKFELANKEQDRRLGSLESDVKQMTELIASVKELSVNMQNMAKEQEKQSEHLSRMEEKQDERLAKLEGRDGEKWRTIVSYILTAVVGAVLAFFLAKLGL